MPESTLVGSGKTGEECSESGPYRSSGPSGAVVYIKKGDVFPPDVDGSSTVWTLVAEDPGA